MKPTPMFAAVEALSRREQENYSIAKLIEAEADRVERQLHGLPSRQERAADESRKMELARLGGVDASPEPRLELGGPRTLEHELARALDRELQHIPLHGGVLVPLRVRASSLSTKTDAGGAYTVGSENVELVDALAAQSRLVELGAVMVTGMRNKASFPLEDSAASAQWASEDPGSDVSEDDPSLSMVTASGKMVTDTTSFSRRLLATASPSLEGWLRRRLMRGSALALDHAGIAGSGTSNQPIGILNTSGIGSVSASGSAPTNETINDLEAAVGNAGADARSNAFLTTPDLRTALRSTPAFTGATSPLWVGNSMNGYTAAVSGHVPDDAIVHGDFSKLLILEWGVIEILVDPFRLKKRGQLEITSYLISDVVIVAPAAFAACTDAVV